MSHPLLSRAEIEALLSQGSADTPQSSAPVGLQETGTGVAAWHELVTLIWRSVANTLSSPARPVRARIVRETLITLPLADTRSDGEEAEAPVYVQLAASPDWLGSFLVLGYSAAGRMEEMAGGEWPPAAGALPGLPDAVPYPASFAELVADEVRVVLRDVIEATVQVQSRSVASLPELAGQGGANASTWLGVEIELTWGKQSAHLLHLFLSSLPALLYRALSGSAAHGPLETGPCPVGEGADSPGGAQEGDQSLVERSDRGGSIQVATGTAPGGVEAAAAILPERGVLKTGSHQLRELAQDRTRRAESRFAAGAPTAQEAQDSPVLVRPVSFAPLEGGQGATGEADNLELLMDVPLDITVELGRASLSMREVLTLGKGSILELDHMAGEPVDILVNGRLIAKGEVVVVDDTFGVKVSAIVSPDERLREGGAGQSA